ncbi:GNAT family N-acetyltransferase [Chitinophaga varians]|uniref:GNAT family N-acetyltransferase n=1 Tax=Chitinophaga varians TaxID=2202339 RepID=UPI00165FF926|nr:GNAT family N-acetyltransferase [Chitinophaga varians]MBC9910018.1 GNAT family N-acetyltransferase [Chitinophaga varians]
MTNQWEIKTGIGHMDLAAIHQFLQNDSYWAKGIDFELVKASLENSFCIGVFLDNQQIGFARVITDYTTFGWLADVFVLPAYRGRGISKAMMRFLTDLPWVGKLRRLMLSTLDAHELYRGYGFKNLGNAASMMEVHRPDVYLKPTTGEASAVSG